MSSAHIFYIPVILLVGVFAGFFIGKSAAEKEAAERTRRMKRREALKKKKGEAESE